MAGWGETIRDALIGGSRTAGDVVGIGNQTAELAARVTAVASYSVPGFDADNNQYKFQSLMFPSTVSSEQQGHYMVININVPVWANSPETPRTQFTEKLKRGGIASTLDTLRFGDGDPAYPDAQQKEIAALPRFTRRLEKAIALYMPNGALNYVSQHMFNDIKLTGVAAGIIGGLFNIEGGYQLGGGASGGLPQLGGMPINPRVEVLYSNTNLREFQFEFFLAPETEEESRNMKNIIDALRYYSAPELSKYTKGFTFVPPAEFDIKFYKNGIENTHIPRINTCVLEAIEVDYTPGGEWVTFSNGHPVYCRLNLRFKELEIVHKLRIRQGY
jgi:hypothetical protein